MTGRELWTLVDSVRNRCYDIFVFAEKKRLHDLVCRLKTKGDVTAADLEWRKVSDENLRDMGIAPARFSRRRLPRAKRRPRDNG